MQMEMRDVRDRLLLLARQYAGLLGYLQEELSNINTPAMLVLLQEYQAARTALFNQLKGLAVTSGSSPTQSLWRAMREVPAKQFFSKIVTLAEILCCPPPQSACCERGFSAVTYIKNDLRSNLKAITLDAQLRCFMWERSRPGSVTNYGTLSDAAKIWASDPAMKDYQERFSSLNFWAFDDLEEEEEAEEDRE